MMLFRSVTYSDEVKESQCTTVGVKILQMNNLEKQLVKIHYTMLTTTEDYNSYRELFFDWHQIF